MRHFAGEISGKKLSSFNPSSLENLDKYEERLEVIESMIVRDEDAYNFFAEYMNKYFKVSPNVTDELSEEDAVCNMLSLFATYLLSSKDIQSERKVEYKFWKSERDFKKSDEFKKTINESQLSNGNEEDNRVEVIDMFVNKASKNCKKPKDVKITANDIKTNKHIGELNEAIKYVKSDVGEKNIKKHIQNILEDVKDEKHKAVLQRVLHNYKTYMRKYVASMKDSQVLIKKATNVVVSFENQLDESGFPIDWENVDISNRKVFIILLNALCQRDSMSDDDICIVTYDLYEFLTKKAGLSERELEVVKMFGNGMEQAKIADVMGVTKSSLSSYINRIHSKVVKSGYTIE